MNSSQRIARIVGILFIIGTVAGIVSVGFTGDMLTAPDYLTQVSAHGNQLIAGALCVLIMGFALAMIPLVIYPVFKKQNESLALGYVVFRGGLETVAYIGLATIWLLLIPLSQHYASAGASDTSYFQTVGTLLQEAAQRGDQMLTLIFGLGALIFYYLLYRSQLVPRWLAVWGYIGIALHLASGLLAIFALVSPLSPMQAAMNIPIALQEMVLAVWLIVRGFNPSAVVFQTAHAAQTK